MVNRIIVDSLMLTWISEQKHLWSQEAGRDIGTPATVDRILSMQREAKKDHSEHGNGRGTLMVCLAGHTFYERKQLILGYLSSYSVTRENGLNISEAELKRFISQRDGVPLVKVSLNSDSVKAYCNDNKLSDEFGLALIKNLHIYPYRSLEMLNNLNL